MEVLQTLPRIARPGSERSRAHGSRSPRRHCSSPSAAPFAPAAGGSRSLDWLRAWGFEARQFRPPPLGATGVDGSPAHAPSDVEADAPVSVVLDRFPRLESRATDISSRASRTAALRGCSPGASFPPGNSHRPSRCSPRARLRTRTWPSRRRTTTATSMHGSITFLASLRSWRLRAPTRDRFYRCPGPAVLGLSPCARPFDGLARPQRPGKGGREGQGEKWNGIDDGTGEVRTRWLCPVNGGEEGREHHEREWTARRRSGRMHRNAGL
jgi:hypothetical protein